MSGVTALPVSVMIGSPGGEGASLARNWRVTGVIAGERFASDRVECSQVRSGPDGDLYLWRGFRLRLRPSQAGDYALNLGSGEPRVFVIARFEEDAGLRPLQLTVSLDEAQNLDTTELRSPEELVLSAPMPAEVGRWVEDFVNTHYQPRKRRKRGKKRSKAIYDAEVGDYAGDQS
ncbi:MAG: DUF3305 domain-containing protein [Ectothiorhodospiraceae bacterium]|nr:DUF3305 domain-containing protein [Ectothiorhodospiraceae bacterium]